MSESSLTPAASVSLREITTDNLREVCCLAVAPEQTRFVASATFSIAEASFHPNAWYRAIYADQTPVGFVMLAEDRVTPRYYLWRFLIDARYQRDGFGRRALQLVVERVGCLPGATDLFLSYVPGEGSPAPFYAKFGFAETGEEDDGERIMRLHLGAVPSAGDVGDGLHRGAVLDDEAAAGRVIRPSRRAKWNPEKMGKATLYQSKHLLVGLNCLEPGQEHAIHVHAGMDKAYHVLSGEGRFLFQDRELPMQAGEMLIAPEGMPHGIRNSGKARLLVLAVLAPAPLDPARPVE